MLDVDHFKRINDTHGHDAGDAVLRALSRELAGQLRGSDIVCRYGGEEFVLVMPEASLEVACARAHAVREAVAALEVAHAAAPVGRVTVSVGVAAFPQHGARAEALIAAADKALYAAKRAGRNRVVCAGGDAASGSGLECARMPHLNT